MTAMVKILLTCALTGYASSNRDLVRPGEDLIREDSGMAWKPIEYRDVPLAVRLVSRNYIEQILISEAAPWRDSALRVEMKLPKDKRFYDLLRYTWTFRNREIQVTESLNALRIQVPRPGGRGMDEAFREVFDSIFMVKGLSREGVPYELRIPALDGLQTGDAFSSNPDAKIPSTASWRDRFDGSIKEGGFELYFYKRIPQLIGFRDGHGWITGRFRSEKKSGPGRKGATTQ